MGVLTVGCTFTFGALVLYVVVFWLLGMGLMKAQAREAGSGKFVSSKRVELARHVDKPQRVVGMPKL